LTKAGLVMLEADFRRAEAGKQQVEAGTQRAGARAGVGASASYQRAQADLSIR